MRGRDQIFVLSRANCHELNFTSRSQHWIELFTHSSLDIYYIDSLIIPFAVSVAKTAQYAHHVPALNQYDYSDYGHYDGGHYDAGHYDAGHYDAGHYY